LSYTANLTAHRPKDLSAGQLRYVDGSRSPSFYTASPAESDIEMMTGDYGMSDRRHNYGNKT